MAAVEEAWNEAENLATAGEYGDAPVCCVPRLSIGPRAGHHAASAVILFSTQFRSEWRCSGAFLDAKTSLPRSSDLERRESANPA